MKLRELATYQNRLDRPKTCSTVVRSFLLPKSSERTEGFEETQFPLRFLEEMGHPEAQKRPETPEPPLDHRSWNLDFQEKLATPLVVTPLALPEDYEPMEKRPTETHNEFSWRLRDWYNSKTTFCEVCDGYYLKRHLAVTAGCACATSICHPNT